MSSLKKKYQIVLKYLPNYKVKYCFFNNQIKECESAGWYSIIGHKLCCNTSILKSNNSLNYVCEITDLPKEYFDLFKEEQLRYENSIIHKNRLQSFNQLLINKS